MRDQIVTMLRDRGIDYVDLMPCLSALDVSELFIAGHQHYSPKGNARVAACLQPVIRSSPTERTRQILFPRSPAHSPALLAGPRER